jgi:hypothetical protein
LVFVDLLAAILLQHPVTAAWGWGGRTEWKEGKLVREAGWRSLMEKLQQVSEGK